MATSTITNTITDPSGTAVANVRVIVRTCPRGSFRTADGSEVAPTVETTTNASGVWSLSLERNSGITPANSYYEVEEQLPINKGGPRHYTIQVGSSNQTLLAALVSPIPDITSSNYLTQAAADARYLQSPAGLAYGSPPDSRPNDALSSGVATSVSRSDHKHSRETTSGTNAARLALAGNNLYHNLRWRNTDLNKKLYEYRTATWLQREDLFIVADEAARTGFVDPYEGVRVYVESTNREWIYDGSFWRLLPSMNTSRAYVVRTTLQSLTAATITPVAFNAADIYDTDSIHDTAVNNSRLILPFVGLWEIKYGLLFGTVAGVDQEAWIGLNTAGAGTGNRYGWTAGNSSATSSQILTSSVMMATSAANDYVEIFAYSASGSTIGGTGASYDIWAQATYLGAIF